MRWASILLLGAAMGSIRLTPQDTAPFPTFEYHRIDNLGSQLGQTSLVDVDKDGDLDWIAGQAARSGGEIWWWEYRGPDSWVRHLLGHGNTDVGGSAYDLTKDGWVDMLSGSKVLINPVTPRQSVFQSFEIGAIYSHDSEFADINGDGRMDALANSDEVGLQWYEIPDDPRETWKAHFIERIDRHQIHGGVSPKATGDIDGDGDIDVVTGQAWYENVDGSGLTWEQHRNIDFGEIHRYGLAVRTWVIDMDGDADLDVVQAEADNPDGRVGWFENSGHGTWVRHIIKRKGDRQDFHSLIVADFDLDDDQDVFSCGGPLSEGPHFNYIWENRAGPTAGPTSEMWIEHVVGDWPCHEAVGGDVDADGDVDICSKPWSSGNEHYYLRNMTVESRRP